MDLVGVRDSIAYFGEFAFGVASGGSVAKLQGGFVGFVEF